MHGRDLTELHDMKTVWIVSEPATVSVTHTNQQGIT